MQSRSQTVRQRLNVLLRRGGFQLLRTGEKNPVKAYPLSLGRALHDAKRAGISLGDYVDKTFNVPGATQAAIDKLAELGVFGGRVRRICEIGPGTGRHLAKIKKLCDPCDYEIYEPEREWSDWLVASYAVVAHESDGVSLRDTSSESVDLVCAHKVFSCAPFVATCNYFREMIRVARPGGRIVFDIVSESCMSDEVLDKWMASAIYYPCILPREFAVDFFLKRGCSLQSSFLSAMMPGKSEYLIFVKGEQSVASGNQKRAQNQS